MKPLLIIASAVFLIACQPATDSGDGSGSVTDTAMEQLRGLYDKALESNPGEAVDWATDDLKKIGDWEYKIVTLDTPTPELLEQELNTLGTERWEVYWVEQVGGQKRFYLKRSARSYLRAIPLSEIGKILSPDASN